jgi:large subunit ribosomal protein L3
VLNIEVVQVDAERNVLAVKGAVPGSNGGVLFVRKARKQKRAPVGPALKKQPGKGK